VIVIALLEVVLGILVILLKMKNEGQIPRPTIETAKLQTGDNCE
jgi:hypothetical protein